MLLVRGKDDDVMRTVVSSVAFSSVAFSSVGFSSAARMAAPGDVVLLATAASADRYSSYPARGDVCADTAMAARTLPGRVAGLDTDRIGTDNWES